MGGARMVKIVRTIAVLGCVGSFAGLAIAQGKQGEKFGSDVPAAVGKLEAQCAHRRRMMPPDERDGCAGTARDTQLTYGQGGGAGVQARGGAQGILTGGGQGRGRGGERD